ncbi:MAG: pentapeptide repeat-containing protein [Deltaproteobacteria bacterium]|nr:pentapeptide repeat-containing protein [Deltaproteobacteria bacterium]
MAKCIHHDVCGLNAEIGFEGFCILHCVNPDKDKKAFAKKFEEHRKNKGDDFSYFVFPESIDFRGITFTKKVSFAGATFTKETNFAGVTFPKEADFTDATFIEEAFFFETKFIEEAFFFETTFIGEANFTWATFTENAHFTDATFTEETYFPEAAFIEKAIFFKATFNEQADFAGATFTKEADFSWATFMRGASFDGSIFKEGDAIFSDSHLFGRTLFLGEKGNQEKIRNPIFSNVTVYFNNVDINPPNAVIFRDADLGRCSFLGTRIDQVEFTNVKWAMIRKTVLWKKLGYSRTAIYDEKIIEKKDEDILDWEHIERVYRDLKINHTASGDHERAGDFHYGEKEMRRRNPSSPRMHRFFLNLYRLLSGYGERYAIPLFWAFFILVGSTIGYLALGIGMADGLSLGIKDWFTVLLYSLQVMTLLRPTELQPIGVASNAIKVFQSISGPIIIGLFALALKQRLRR